MENVLQHGPKSSGLSEEQRCRAGIDGIASEAVDPSKQKAPGGKLAGVLSSILLVLLLFIVIALVGLRVAGLQPFVVLSGSMEPVYPTGSLIYVKPMEAAELNVGDPVTFVLNEQLTVVTHRIIKIDAESSYLYTKGDANEDPDLSPVYFSNVVGTPVLCVPFLGYLSHFVSTPPGLYLTVAIAILLVAALLIPDQAKRKKHAERKRSR